MVGGGRKIFQKWFKDPVLQKKKKKIARTRVNATVYFVKTWIKRQAGIMGEKEIPILKASSYPTHKNQMVSPKYVYE